jgi:hypothetical protein
VADQRAISRSPDQGVFLSLVLRQELPIGFGCGAPNTGCA